MSAVLLSSSIGKEIQIIYKKSGVHLSQLRNVFVNSIDIERGHLYALCLRDNIPKTWIISKISEVVNAKEQFFSENIGRDIQIVYQKNDESVNNEPRKINVVSVDKSHLKAFCLRDNHIKCFLLNKIVSFQEIVPEIVVDIKEEIFHWETVVDIPDEPRRSLRLSSAKPLIQNQW